MSMTACKLEKLFGFGKGGGPTDENLHTFTKRGQENGLGQTTESGLSEGKSIVSESYHPSPTFHQRLNCSSMISSIS